MNHTIEKWLTIAALAGWVASIGSLIGLAIRATAPESASRPTLTTVRVQNLETQQISIPKKQLESAAQSIKAKPR